MLCTLKAALCHTNPLVTAFDRASYSRFSSLSESNSVLLFFSSAEECPLVYLLESAGFARTPFQIRCSDVILALRRVKLFLKHIIRKMRHSSQSASRRPLLDSTSSHFLAATETNWCGNEQGNWWRIVLGR